MLGTGTVTAFAADVDLVWFRVIVNVHFAHRVVDGPDQELPCRLVLISLPSGQMAARAHSLHGVVVDGRGGQHIVWGAVLLVSTGRPPHIELVVLPDAPFPMQPVIPSGHVVPQHGVPALTIAQAR